MVAHRYDVVFLDFYGTVCSGDRDVVERACQRIVTTLRVDLDAPSFAIAWGERFFATLERCNHDRFQTLHACELASLAATFDDLGLKADPAPFVEALETYWRNPPIYPDAVQFLQDVTVPVCCVSNADTEALLAAVEKHGLRFDFIISSEQARCYKPDPEIFRQALAMTGAAPDRAVHVGDSLHSDVAGARRAGIDHVWIRRENRIHDIGTDRPSRTISRLTELTTKFNS